MNKTQFKQILVASLLICFAATGFAVTAKALKQGQRFTKAPEASKLLERLNFESAPLPLNYFQKIRIELSKAAQAEAAAAKKHGVMLNSLIKLTPDTLGFFVATGAVNFMTMWNASSGNPLLFQQQVIGMKDPIAHLSFYSFIAANGFYSNWQTGKLKKMSPQAREMEIRKISYAGMAAGSLASSVTADIGAAITGCSNNLLKNRTAEATAADDSACEAALKTWTTRNLTQKYVPQIFSLLVVQAATEFTHKGIAYGATGILNVLKGLGAKTGLKISAIDLVLYATPGKFGIQLFKVVGKVTQFTFFVGIDHLLNNTLTRGLNNILKPAIFKTFDLYTLNTLFEVGTKYQWNVEKISTLTPMAFPENRADKNTSEAYLNFSDFSTKFPAEITNFTERMQEWRDHLNANVELDLTEWMNLTTRMYNQIQTSENFYDSFLSEMFTYANTDHRVKLAELSPEAFNNTTGFPYRTLPLYGVKFIPWVNSDGKTTNVEPDKAYLLFPKETELAQSNYLRAFAAEFLKSEYYKKIELTAIHKEFMNMTLQKLMSADVNEQSSALKNLVEFRIIQYQIGAQAKSNLNFIHLRLALLKEIGEPEAKMNRGEGFAGAFALANKAQIETADFDGASLITTNTSIFNASSILMHQMICGDSFGKIKNYEIGKTDITLWQPDFIAPAIVTSQAKEFCNVENRIYDEDFYKTKLTNAQGVVFSNPADFIFKNINVKILGDYTDKTKKTDFTTWWADNVLFPILPNLNKWDKIYSNLIVKMDQNLFPHGKTSVQSVVDDLTLNNFNLESFLPSKNSESFKFETEFYLQTIHLVTTKQQLYLPAKGDNSVVVESKKLSKNQYGNVLKKLNSETATQITTSLKQMLNELEKPVTQLDIEYQTLNDQQLTMILTDQNKMAEFEKQMNYKKYLQFKENFEQGISKIETAAGLKTAQASALDENKLVFTDAKVATPNFEQSVIIAAAQGLRSIESNISRYVRMKLLVRYGLKFSTEDNKKSQNEAVNQATSRGVLQRK